MDMQQIDALKPGTLVMYLGPIHTTSSIFSMKPGALATITGDASREHGEMLAKYQDPLLHPPECDKLIVFVEPRLLPDGNIDLNTKRNGQQDGHYDMRDWAIFTIPKFTDPEQAQAWLDTHEGVPTNAVSR